MWRAGRREASPGIFAVVGRPLWVLVNERRWDSSPPPEGGRSARASGTGGGDSLSANTARVSPHPGLPSAVRPSPFRSLQGRVNRSGFPTARREEGVCGDIDLNLTPMRVAPTVVDWSRPPGEARSVVPDGLATPPPSQHRARHNVTGRALSSPKPLFWRKCSLAGTSH